MTNGTRFHFKAIFFILFSALSLNISAQENQEIVPIVIPEAKTYDWVAQELPFWGVKVLFPETPDQKSNDIYTEKGLVKQRVFYWSDYREELILESSFYKLSESIHSKNEKKLIDNVANRIAVIHGGYPILSSGTTNAQNIREFYLEIKTLRGGVYQAKIFAESDQVLIVSSLVTKADQELQDQAKYFLSNISFQPLPGEVQNEVNNKNNLPSIVSQWDEVAIENFSVSFPKKPIEQHKILNVGDSIQRYYEWYMGDGVSQMTYLFAVIPLSDLKPKNHKDILQLSIQSSLQVTNGEVLLRRSLDYFKYPLEEIIFKTEQQYFRVRYFYDDNYLYQLLVSGEKGSIHLPDANRFLDGLKWMD